MKTMNVENLYKLSSVWSHVSLPANEIENLERDGLVVRRGTRSKMFKLTLRGHKAKLGLMLDQNEPSDF